jgi:hypothetical protein
MKKIFFAAVIIAVAGCSENTIVQTVDWYKEHENERKEMLAKCKSDPGQLSASANCINATKAANHLTLDNRGYRNRAPINLSEGGK